uniref:Uncharacterized protein n=1 Tax=Latimeria chalumnae TaxID=7897 RepID=M3XKS0_LATCH
MVCTVGLHKKYFFSFQINIVFPIVYLLFLTFLLIFNVVTNPVTCGLGLGILLAAIPFYFCELFSQRKCKPCRKYKVYLVYVLQKLCIIVYPEEKEPKHMPQVVKENTDEEAQVVKVTSLSPLSADVKEKSYLQEVHHDLEQQT